MQFVEKRVYLVEVEYNSLTHASCEVFRSLVERFPEYKDSKYDYEYISGGISVLRIYRESCFDFVEL